jgi:hypothetical protein
VFASVPATVPCLAFDTNPKVSQQALRPNGIPKTYKGKTPFCGLPNVTNSQGEANHGLELRLMVVGGNLESTGGTHDVFGFSDPEVTKVTGSFADGTMAEASVGSGTFVLVWNGPKSLDKLTAYAGDKRLSDCVPPRWSDFLILKSELEESLSFGCQP